MSAQVRRMANIKNPQQQPVQKEADVLEQERPHRTPTERAKLSQDPNLNQAGNDKGSADNTQGLQTGSDIDE